MIAGALGRPRLLDVLVRPLVYTCVAAAAHGLPLVIGGGLRSPAPATSGDVPASSSQPVAYSEWGHAYEPLLPTAPDSAAAPAPLRRAGSVQSTSEGRPSTAAPSRTLSAALTQSGTRTGQWFSRAGDAIAEGVAPR